MTAHQIEGGIGFIESCLEYLARTEPNQEEFNALVANSEKSATEIMERLGIDAPSKHPEEGEEDSQSRDGQGVLEQSSILDLGLQKQIVTWLMVTTTLNDQPVTAES